MNIKHILNGWKHYTFPSAEIEAIATGRAEQCAQCDSAVRGTYELLMPDWTMKKTQGLKCRECGCPLSTKLRCEDEVCPLGRW